MKTGSVNNPLKKFSLEAWKGREKEKCLGQMGEVGENMG